MKKKIYGIYTILFIIIFGFILSMFIVRGNGMISTTDGYHQTFPILVYIKKYINDFLTGNRYQFDFRIGLGDDIIQTMNYYGILDPVSILCAIIFPFDYMEYGYILCIALKLYLSGIAFLYYVQNHMEVSEYAILGSLLYTFNIYTLYWGIYFPPYLTVMMTFPLILRGIDELCSHKKISKVLILSLGMQGVNGFYHLYMEIVITVLYFLYIVFFRDIKGKNLKLKNYLKTTCFIIINGLLGIGLSAVVLFPSIIGFLNSTRKSGEINTVVIYDIKNFISSLGELIIPNTDNSITSLSILSVVSILCCLFNKKSKKEYLYFTVTLWLLTWCPFFGSLMNGFSYATDRWYFGVNFFVDLLMVSILEKEEKMTLIQKIGFIFVGVVTTIIHIQNTTVSQGIIVRVIISWILIAVCIYIWNIKRERHVIMLVYGSAMILIIVFFIFGPRTLGGTGYSANFKENGVYNEIVNSDKNIERNKKSFERWDFYNSSHGASLVADFYGTTEYFSTINSNVSDFFKEMYISPGIRAADFMLRGVDGRKELMALLSVTRYMDFSSREKENFFKDNKLYLPMGITYDSYVSKEYFNKLNPMEKTTQILKTVVLEDNQGEEENINIENYQNKKLAYKVSDGKNKEEVKVYIHMDKYEELWKQGKGEVYIQLKNIHGDATIYIGNKEIKVAEKSSVYYTGIDDFWINLTEILEDESGRYFNVSIKGTTDFGKESIGIYWHPIDEKEVNEKSKDCLQNLQLKNDVIEGNIEVEGEKFLFFSIPYSRGWRAYVDEEEVDVLKANIGFMAILLKDGKHKIELNYSTPGFGLGLICSGISIIIVVLWIIVERRKDCKNK